MSHKVKKPSKKKKTSLALPDLKTLDPNAMTRDKIELIKNTIAVEATDNELKLFLHVCQRTGLDPFAKQIYLIHRNTKRGKIATIQTGIDGFRSVAERSGNYAGSDEPVFTYAAEDKKEEKPLKVSVTIHKIVQGINTSTSRSARWGEYYPKSAENQFKWNDMPHVMLAKCAEAQALRAAFPAVLGGLYVVEEMDQAGPMDKKNRKIVDQGEMVPPPIVTKENAISLFIAKIKSTTSIDTLTAMRADYQDNPKVDKEVKIKLDSLIDGRIDQLMPQ